MSALLISLVSYLLNWCFLEFSVATVGVGAFVIGPSQISSFFSLRYITNSFNNIYNGNIFPSLNPAKIFQFISR